MLAINQTDLDPAGKAREQLWLPEIDCADGVVNDHAVQIMNLLVDIRIVRQHRGDELPERRVCAQKFNVRARLQAAVRRVKPDHDGLHAAGENDLRRLGVRDDVELSVFCRIARVDAAAHDDDARNLFCSLRRFLKRQRDVRQRSQRENFKSSRVFFCHLQNEICAA